MSRSCPGYGIACPWTRGRAAGFDSRRGANFSAASISIRRPWTLRSLDRAAVAAVHVAAWASRRASRVIAALFVERNGVYDNIDSRQKSRGKVRGQVSPVMPLDRSERSEARLVRSPLCRERRCGAHPLSGGTYPETLASEGSSPCRQSPERKVDVYARARRATRGATDAVPHSARAGRTGLDKQDVRLRPSVKLKVHVGTESPGLMESRDVVSGLTSR